MTPEQYEKWDYIRSSRLHKIAHIRRMAEEDGEQMEVWESRYSQDVPFLMALIEEMRGELALATHFLAVDTDLLKSYRGAYGRDHRNPVLAASLDDQNESAVKYSEAVITRVVDGNHYRYPTGAATLTVSLVDRWRAETNGSSGYVPFDGKTHEEATAALREMAAKADAETAQAGGGAD